MRIAELFCRVETKHFDRLLRNPRTTWDRKHTFLVFVRTDTGLLGVGEAWCEATSPRSLATFVDVELAPLFVGMPVEDVERIWQHTFERTRVSAKPGITLCALGAIETACWDVLAQAAQRPLHRLLGSRFDCVPVYASGGLYADDKSLAELGREMRSYVDAGFRAVKMKVAGATLSDDVARVAAVREAIGPSTRLMVDAVYMLDFAGAMRMARAFEDYDVWFLEAPIAPGDIPGLKRLTARSPIPIAGNEVAFGLDGYRDLIVEGGVDVVHLDVNQCGGVQEARRIAALAAAFHRPVSFHCATSAVCLLANLHTAASVANAESVEYHMVHQMLFDKLDPSTLRITDGKLALPSAPGLGISVDPEALADPSTC